MNRVATLSIALALAVILLPWQICDCNEDGPHWKPLWLDADCHPADHPAPADRSGESDSSCDGLFQFEGVAASAAVDLPTPSEGDAYAHPSTLMAVCTEVLPARATDPLTRPPTVTALPASPLRHATRLLL